MCVYMHMCVWFCMLDGCAEATCQCKDKAYVSCAYVYRNVCVCVHMRMNLKGGSSGCQAHAIWAAGEGVAEVRSQN